MRESRLYTIKSTLSRRLSALLHKFASKAITTSTLQRPFPLENPRSLFLIPTSPSPSLLPMLMILLQRLARLLLQTLNIMLRIRNLLSIRLDLQSPKAPHQHPIFHNPFPIPSQEKERHTYRRLGITPQLPLPMALPLPLLIQLVLLMVLNLRFALVYILICNYPSARHSFRGLGS